MTELTQDLSKLGMEDFKKRFDPDLNVNDFSAVHEAYQYLVVEYVEKVIHYSRVPNKRAAQINNFLKISNLHGLITSCRFINF